MKPNEHRVNRLARQALVKLGRKPDAHGAVYGAQLMRWALDEGLLPSRGIDLELLHDAVCALERVPQEDAMRFLSFGDDTPAASGLRPRDLIGQPPRDIALALLRDLSDKLASSAGGPLRAAALGTPAVPTEYSEPVAS